MDVRFIRANGIHGVGQVVSDYHSGAAAELIRRGIAEPLATTKQSVPAAGSSTVGANHQHHGKKHRR